MELRGDLVATESELWSGGQSEHRSTLDVQRDGLRKAMFHQRTPLGDAASGEGERR